MVQAEIYSQSHISDEAMSLIPLFLTNFTLLGLQLLGYPQPFCLLRYCHKDSIRIVSYTLSTVLQKGNIYHDHNISLCKNKQFISYNFLSIVLKNNLILSQSLIRRHMEGSSQQTIHLAPYLSISFTTTYKLGHKLLESVVMGRCH